MLFTVTVPAEVVVAVVGGSDGGVMVVMVVMGGAMGVTIPMIQNIFFINFSSPLHEESTFLLNIKWRMRRARCTVII